MHLLLAGLIAYLLLPTGSSAPGLPQRFITSAAAPLVLHGSLDCSEGYHVQSGVNGLIPDGWRAITNVGAPYLTSTQLWGRGGSCDPNEPWWKWEKIEGHDSFLFMGGYAPQGQDFPSPPFDATLYQQVQVTAGVTYSLSAWMMSLCGGSAMPNDCPAGQYIAKLVGVDPTGGVDPHAQSVAWLEDRRPHTESRWVDFSPTVQAQDNMLTVFLRAKSPFTHHGNHVYADGVMLVRAPTAVFTAIKPNAGAITLNWQGDLGADIAAIPAGNYKAFYTVDYQTRPDGPWWRWRTGVTDEAGVLPISKCAESLHRFRVRVTAEQPAGEPGAWPPHRFAGPWHVSQPVSGARAADCRFGLWQPHASK